MYLAINSGSRIMLTCLQHIRHSQCYVCFEWKSTFLLPPELPEMCFMNLEWRLMMRNLWVTCWGNWQWRDGMRDGFYVKGWHSVKVPHKVCSYRLSIPGRESYLAQCQFFGTGNKVLDLDCLLIDLWITKNNTKRFYPFLAGCIVPCSRTEGFFQTSRLLLYWWLCVPAIGHFRSLCERSCPEQSDLGNYCAVNWVSLP